MPRRTRIVALLVGAALVLSLPRPAHADRVRFHYAARAVCASAPTGPGAPTVVGERITLFGGTEPYTCQLRPNQVVTLRHYYTGQLVSVPMRLPPDIPLVQHRYNRTIFNYGSYSVEAVF